MAAAAAAADGLNNRRRENEPEGKKKRARVVPPLAAASLRESVIHRDIAESLLTEVSMIPAGERFNSCPDDYVGREGGWEGVNGANSSRHEGGPDQWAIDVFSIPRQSDIIRV